MGLPNLGGNVRPAFKVMIWNKVYMDENTLPNSSGWAGP